MKIKEIKRKSNGIFEVTFTPYWLEKLFGVEEKTKEYKDSGYSYTIDKSTVYIDKKVILEIAKSMGFFLVEDLWDTQGYLTFQLIGELHEKELMLIWNRDEHITQNFSVAAKILFKAGQKAKFYQISTLPYLTI